MKSWQKKEKVGRKLEGKKPKIDASIKVDPDFKKKCIKEFGNLSRGIGCLLRERYE